MEVVVIDKVTFERMLSGLRISRKRWNGSAGNMETWERGNWLDSDDVCRRFGISPRTLQTMRENGTLAYTKISHKVYYRPEDVKAVFPVTGMKRRIGANKGRECNINNL